MADRRRPALDHCTGGIERPDWRRVLRAWPRLVLLAALGMILITVSSVIIGAAIGQPVTLTDLVGGVVVIAGVLITSSTGRKRSAAAAGPGASRPGADRGGAVDAGGGGEAIGLQRITAAE